MRIQANSPPRAVKDLPTLERLFDETLKVLTEADILNTIWLNDGEFDEASCLNLVSLNHPSLHCTVVSCRKWTFGDSGMIIVTVYAITEANTKRVFRIEWISPRQSRTKFPLTFEQLQKACGAAKVPTVESETVAARLTQQYKPSFGR